MALRSVVQLFPPFHAVLAVVPFAPYFTKLYFLDLISSVFKTQKLPFHRDSNKVKILVKTIKCPRFLIEQTHIYAHMGMHIDPMKEREREREQKQRERQTLSLVFY